MVLELISETKTIYRCLRLLALYSYRRLDGALSKPLSSFPDRRGATSQLHRRIVSRRLALFVDASGDVATFPLAGILHSVSERAKHCLECHFGPLCSGACS
jgi:hypothetical protein